MYSHTSNCRAQLPNSFPSPLGTYFLLDTIHNRILSSRHGTEQESSVWELGQTEQVSWKKNSMTPEREEGDSRQEKWDQKFGPSFTQTTRVYFSSHGMSV